MEQKTDFIKKLCDSLGIPYDTGKGYATIDGVPVNKITSPIFEQENLSHNFSCCDEEEENDSYDFYCDDSSIGTAKMSFKITAFTKIAA